MTSPLTEEEFWMVYTPFITFSASWKNPFGEKIDVVKKSSSVERANHDTTVIVLRMAHRKWKETKQQPSMLPGPAFPGCYLVSSHILWAILSTSTVYYCHALEKGCLCHRRGGEERMLDYYSGPRLYLFATPRIGFAICREEFWFSSLHPPRDCRY